MKQSGGNFLTCTGGIELEGNLIDSLADCHNHFSGTINLEPLSKMGAMSKTLVILNPAAKGEKALAFRERIRNLCQSHETECEVRMTSGRGNARHIAEEAVKEGFSTIVAAGGDGTINEVVNGIAGSDVALGLLPVGTMNVFAAELGLPNDVQKCWKIIAEGATKVVDLALANEQFFVQLAGVGLDAQVVEETSWEFKKNFGPLSYLISASQIAARKPPRILIEGEDGVEREGSFVLVGNGRFYGGPFVMFKDARADDGKLDIVIFKNLSHLDMIRYMQGILFGTHMDLHDVEYFQTTKATVRSDERVPVEVDGELAGETPVTFQIAPHRLRVLVPK